MRRYCVAVVASLLIVACTSDRTTRNRPDQSGCTYRTPGDLIQNSGVGVNDETIWAPNMISPFPSDVSYAKSQIYNPGGSASRNSDECAAINFSYPHRDTFCERRSADRNSYNCPSRRIHQGIDINAGTAAQCRQLVQAKSAIRNGSSPELANIIPVVAVEDGVISYIGSYTVDLKPASSRALSKFRYLHLNMQTLNVSFGDTVKQGDVIGYYYDDFGGATTTFHLHLELIAFVDGTAQHVSPYASFINAEKRSRNITCAELG